MSTERKIRASQTNGALSRGPVTAEGKRKSAANSARHHLLSKTVVLDNERPEAFAGHLASFMSEFNPRTETQRTLVENLAVARWRQMRIWALERATLNSAMEARDPESLPPAERAAGAFRTLADDSRALDLLARYETRFERQFARALNLLMKLANPESPLTQFHSGVGLPACPAAEGGSPQAPTEPQPSPPVTEFCQTNLTPQPDTTPAAGDDPAEPGSPDPQPPPAAEGATEVDRVRTDQPSSNPEIGGEEVADLLTEYWQPWSAPKIDATPPQPSGALAVMSIGVC